MIETAIRKRKNNAIIVRPDGRPEIFQDNMLYEWNIYHFHIEAPRGNGLLFVHLVPDDAYVIKIGNHDDFNDIALLRLTETEWPGLLPKLIGISGETLTPEQVGNIRKVNSNVSVDTGNGAMANFDIMTCDGTPFAQLMAHDIAMDLLRSTPNRFAGVWDIISRQFGGEPESVAIEIGIHRCSPMPDRIALVKGDQSIGLERTVL